MIANTLSRAGRLVFTAPPPGLSPIVDFELDEVEGAVGLYAMRDTVGADLRLFLLDPAFFVPEYQPQLTDEHLAPLGVDDSQQVDVYVVATLSGGAPVVNLLAPILVHPVTHAATQVILDGADWPLQAELVSPEG
jgi:flagellar assembly factor FliW